MIWTLELVILFATVPLVYHAQKVYSRKLAILFWVTGFGLAVCRELAMTYFSGIYAYQHFHLVAFGFPLIFAVFWSNLIYVSWQWSNNLLGREFLTSKVMDQHLPLVFVVLMFLSFMLETSFSQYGLIDWKADSVKPLWGNTPLLAPFSYGFSGIVFLKGMRGLLKQEHRFPARRLLTGLALQPIIVIIIMGLLLITNAGIILIFS